VLGGIKSTVAGLMRASHDSDDDDSEAGGAAGAGGVGLWSRKHAAVGEGAGEDALAEKEEVGEGQAQGLPQV
jgi:hypothetical protein